MSTKEKPDLHWDADVIEFWNTALQSYKTCHDNEKTNNTDSETITSEFMDLLPKKHRSETSLQGTESSANIASTAALSIQASVATKIPQKRKVIFKEEEQNNEDVHEKANEAEVKEEEKNEKEEENEYEYEYEYDDEEEEKEEEEGQEEENKELQEEQHTYNQSNKKAKYQNEQNQEESYYPQYNQQPQQPFAATPPPIPPSIPPMPSQDNEAFSNLIMSWYYAGYYTGLYQAGQR